MRTGRVHLLLAAAALLAMAPGDPAAGDMAQDGGEAAPPWAEHAASGDDVARAGRSAMPFTAEQIEALGRLLRETQRAASVAADPPPAGRIRRVRIGAPGAGAIPTIAVRKGYVTAISFTGVTGAPWPIEEALVDGRFLSETVLSETVPSASGGEGRGGAGPGASPAAGRHLLYLAPQARSLHGNAAVKLLGLAEPLALSLRGGGEDADFRVEIRLGLPGPNAGPAATARQDFHAGDPVLLDLLGGMAPPGAERLAVDGGSADDRAWRLGGTPWPDGDLLLATRADLLSPGPWAAERGAGGRWAYRLPDVPYALVSRDGREWQLAFRSRDEAQPMPAMDGEGERR